MSDPRQDDPKDGPRRELSVLRRHEESNTMLAIVMAGIAGLFIIAIVAAYNYASSDYANVNENPPASASAPAPRSPPETTGSGGESRLPPPPREAVPDRSMQQQ
jgi:hypothetical protein